MLKRIFDALRIRLSRAIVPRVVSSRRVQISHSCCFIGMPIVRCSPESKVFVGERVALISSSWATALGVNHPVVLRTLQAGAEIVVGEGTGISGGTFCAAKSIVIGTDCLFGANVTVVDTDFHHINPALRHNSNACHRDAKPVAIGDNVFVGMGAMILKGVSIGDNSVIGAGSVVSKDIPANVIAAGNPCRVIRELGSE